MILFFGQFQLQRQAGWHHAPAVGGCGQPSTIVREAAGKPMSTAYEARDVYVVNLPELFLHFRHTRYARDIYKEWLWAEIIIGRKPPRGQSGKGKGKGKGGEKGKCKTKTWMGSESGRAAGGDSGHTLSACAFHCHQPLAVNASAVGGNDLPEPAGACAERAATGNDGSHAERAHGKRGFACRSGSGNCSYCCRASSYSSGSRVAVVAVAVAAVQL